MDKDFSHRIFDALDVVLFKRGHIAVPLAGPALDFNQ
jgi:hypothetical protein